MNERAQFGLWDWITLALILIIGVGARALYVYKHASKAAASGRLRVQDELAKHDQDDDSTLLQLVSNVHNDNDLKSTAPFSAGPESTAHTSPGYPYVVATLSRMDKEHSNWPRWTRWMQCGFGGLTAVLYFLFALRAFRLRSVAFLAGLLTALHPYWIVNAAELNDGTLTAFALAWALHLGARASERERPFSALLFGLVLAGLTLLRAPMLPFAFVAMIWFLWRCRRQEKGWLSAVLAFLGFINGLVPWTIRNFKTFKAPVPIVSTAYYHLWIGNNPDANGGPLTPRRAQQPANMDKNLQDLPQVQRYRELGKPVLHYAKTHPRETIENRLNAGVAFLFGHRWVTKRTVVSEIKSDADALPGWLRRNNRAIFIGVLFGMLFFGFLGWRWSFGWRDSSHPMALAMIWIPLPYLLSHAEMLHGPRMPLDGILLTLSAFALFCFLPGTRKHLLAGENAPEKAEQQT